jgi:hypothetical protein
MSAALDRILELVEAEMRHACNPAANCSGGRLLDSVESVPDEPDLFRSEAWVNTLKEGECGLHLPPATWDFR